MDAAASMFSEKGYDRTTLDDIAAALSVTKPSLYYHFSGKEEILQECVWEAYERLHAEIKRRDRPEHTGRQRIETYLRLYLELIMNDTGVSMVLADERVMSEEGRARYTKLRREMNNELEARLTLGIQDGTVSVPETRLTTFAIFGMFNWVGNWHIRRGSIATEEVFERFMSIIFDGIGPRQSHGLASPPVTVAAKLSA